MRILLTGANGQLGRCFQDRVEAGWEVRATDANELDITNLKDVVNAIEQFKPDIVVNAAAYTAVDKAESDEVIAESVNKTGPYNLALAAKNIGALFIHISTDYVFDGLSNKKYKENDQTNPLSIYGKTKLAGEIAVTDIYDKTIIIRTAWVFSEYGNNFVKTMIRLAKDRDQLKVVSDQFGCPTYAGDIASAIIKLIKEKAPAGIYHYCGDEETNWSDFARKIIEVAYDKQLLDTKTEVLDISTEEYPTAAIRPKYSSLDLSKIKGLNIKPSDWKKALQEVIVKL